MHPSQLAVEELIKQCDFRTQRRSGPGGQHRNKVETGVFVTHEPSGVKANSTEGRSQADNKARAIERLRVRLAIEYRSSESETNRADQAVPYDPSDLWKSRCRGKRISISRQHADFPALLAEAFEALATANWNIPEAAAPLDLSNSQLVKLIAMEREALTRLNSERAKLGLSPLSPR